MRKEILHNMENLGEQLALICANKSYSYRELKELVFKQKEWYEKNFSNRILCVVAGNEVEVVVLILLAALTRGKIILLGDNLRKNEFEYYVKHLGIQAAFLCKRKRDEFELLPEKANQQYALGELECFTYENHNLADAIYRKDDFIIQITSGSEGISKAAARSEFSLTNEIINTCKAVDFSHDQIFMTIPPISHSYGLVIGLLVPLYLGKTIVLVDNFIPDLVEKALIEYKVNVLISVPFIYHILGRRLLSETKKLSSLMKCFSAGGFLDDNVRKKFQDTIGITIWNDYGSTETGVMCIDTEGIPGIVGKPVPGITLSILDFFGEPVQENESGLIHVSGASIGRGYVYPGNLTKTKYYRNMYCTGDIGRMDLSGRIHLEGRQDDFFIVGGEKTSAMEIKSTLLQMESVKDVEIVSEKSPAVGDIISAYIVLKEGSLISESDIFKHCNANMEAFKVPKKIFFIPEIPKNKNGKVLKKYLLN